MPCTPDFAVDDRAVRDEIGRERLVHLFCQMLLIRRFEERAGQMYQQKKIAGFLHLYIGQEAVATGMLAHLTPGKDFVTTSYRCHAQALLLGLDPDELMAELYGKVTGNVHGRGGSMHFFSKEKGLLGGHGIVGGQIPVGSGAAFTAKYLKTGGCSVTFLGDGASPQGSFHESLNMAALWDLPAIYCIENNLYGMGTATQRAVAVQDIAANKAPGYDMPSYTVDGLNPYACWKVGQTATAQARTGRPLLIEFKTYRYRGHSVSDAGSYRSKEEVASYQELDPIARLRRDLVAAKWSTDAELDAIDERILERVRTACQFAEESPEPPLADLNTHVYA